MDQKSPNPGMEMKPLRCCTAKQLNHDPTVGQYEVDLDPGPKSIIISILELTQRCYSGEPVLQGYFTVACMSQKGALQSSREARLGVCRPAATMALAEGGSCPGPRQTCHQPVLLNSVVAHQKHPQTGEAEVKGVCGKAGWGGCSQGPHLCFPAPFLQSDLHMHVWYGWHVYFFET